MQCFALARGLVEPRPDQESVVLVRVGRVERVAEEAVVGIGEVVGAVVGDDLRHDLTRSESRARLLPARKTESDSTGQYGARETRPGVADITAVNPQIRGRIRQAQRLCEPDPRRASQSR
jgi:hypothetical protein